MVEKRYFTEKELAAAKEADLCDVAGELGYTIKRKGRYHTLAEMDSVIIYNRRSWCRWSRIAQTGSNGGSQIDFLRGICRHGSKRCCILAAGFYWVQRLYARKKKDRNASSAASGTKAYGKRKTAFYTACTGSK